MISRPQAVLFACGMNTVRSPMAAALMSQMFGKTVYVASAGVQKGELDPFAVTVMEEIGIDIARHKPMTFEELEDLEGLNFDVIVTLSPPAHHKALELTRISAVEVEYWPTHDPTGAEGNREQRLGAYREVRDQLLARIRERFGWAGRRQRMIRVRAHSASKTRVNALMGASRDDERGRFAKTSLFR